MPASKYEVRIYFSQTLNAEDRKIYQMHFGEKMAPKQITFVLGKELNFITSKISRIKKNWIKIHDNLLGKGFEIYNAVKEVYSDFYICIPLEETLREIFDEVQKNDAKITMSQIEYFAGKASTKTTSAAQVMKHRLQKKYSQDERKIPKKWEIKRKATPEEMEEIMRRDKERREQQEKDALIFQEYQKSMYMLYCNPEMYDKEALLGAEIIARAYNPYTRINLITKQYIRHKKVMAAKEAGLKVIVIPREIEKEISIPPEAKLVERDPDTKEGIWLAPASWVHWLVGKV